MISHHRSSSLAIVAILAALTLLIGACEDGGGQEVPAPIATAQPPEAVFPVILEHDTRLIAAADGSEVREEPVTFDPSKGMEGVPLYGRSPDGRFNAFIREGALFLQEGSGAPREVARAQSTDVFFLLYWAPDSTRLAYLLPTDQSETYAVHVVSAEGGDPALVGESGRPPGESADGPAWSPDASWIASYSPGYDAVRVLSATGATAIEIREGSSGHFSWSPDSRFIAFDSDPSRLDPSTPGSSITVADVADASTRVLAEGYWPRWSPDGERIAFKRDNEVFTIRADGSRLASLGDLGSNFLGELTWSADGAELEYVRGVSAVEYVYAVNLRTGEAMRSPQSLTAHGFRGLGEYIELSPDGMRVTFPVQSGNEGQRTPGWFVMDIGSGAVTQVANDARGDDVHWSDTGIRIAFSGGVSGVFVAEGAGSPPRQVSPSEYAYPLVWSPDGRYLAFGASGRLEMLELDGPDDRTLVSGLDPETNRVQHIEWFPDNSALLYVVDRTGASGLSNADETLVGFYGGPPLTLLQSAGEPSRATLSPDGATVAFTRTDDAGSELRLIDAYGGSERLLTRFEGQSLTLGTATGVGPAIWSPDGTKIAAVLNGTDLYVVEVSTGKATFVATNASYCLMAFLGWSPDGETVYVVPQCALGGI